MNKLIHRDSPVHLTAALQTTDINKPLPRSASPPVALANQISDAMETRWAGKQKHLRRRPQLIRAGFLMDVTLPAQLISTIVSFIRENNKSDRKPKGSVSHDPITPGCLDVTRHSSYNAAR